MDISSVFDFGRWTAMVRGTPVDSSDMASERAMEVADIGPAPPIQKSNPSVQYPPFPTLVGEHALLLSKTTEGTAMVTNFRFCVCECRSFINVPLMMIGELVVAEAYCWLKLGCKDGATYSCTFATVEDCQACVGMLRQRTGLPHSMKDLFAFRFYAVTTFKGSFPDGGLTASEVEQLTLCKPANEAFAYTFGKEVARQGFDTSRRRIWRMSQANEDFEFCGTYPRYHILPATIDDAVLRRSLDFRAMKRFPSVVWRDKSLGVVLIRSSQPMSSFLGLSYYSNHADMSLLEKIVEACHKERKAIEEEHHRQSGRALLDSQAQGVATATAGDPAGGQDGAQGSLVPLDQTAHGASNGTGDPDSPSDAGKLAIVDCRSVAMIWGNSLKGGGTEDEAVYKCSIIHLDLANIHTVRDSFHKLRALCHTYAEGTYFKSLSGCMWLTYITALLRGANIVVDLMQVKRRPVLVHCSDGWDRTSQICSLSELMMDKYYRTLEGFQVLVEREWLHFGHKFAERGGHDPNCSDTNQISPIFLQFLDCVYQLTLQYPAEFQFNEAYLVKLVKHSQACLFGTFLQNCDRERRASEPTASVWSLLQPSNAQFVNLLYKPTHEILTAKYAEHDVSLWKTVYMAGLSPWLHGSQTDFHMESSQLGSAGDEAGGLPRSKSMDDLSRANGDAGRRNSDPMVSPSQECAASAPSGAQPVGGNIHDTSSSSAEILHYPEESTPPQGKAGEKSKQGSEVSGEKSGKPDAAEGDGDCKDGEDVGDSSSDTTIMASKADEPSVSPAPSPAEDKSSSGDCTEPGHCSGGNAVVGGAAGGHMTMSYAAVVNGAGGPDGGRPASDPFPEEEASVKAQALEPSSSSVFSGGDDPDADSTSLGDPGEPAAVGGDSDIPAQLPTSDNNTSTAVVAVTSVTSGTAATLPHTTHTTATTSPNLQGLSLSPSSSSSSSPPVAADVPQGSSATVASEAGPRQDCVNHSTQVGADLNSGPSLPSSSSLHSPTSLQNGRHSSTSLLSERLASTPEAAPLPPLPVSNGTSHRTDRTVASSPSSSSSSSNGVGGGSGSSSSNSTTTTQHSRRGSEDVNDVTAKLKALVDPASSSSRKSNGVAPALGAAGAHANRATGSSSPSKPVHQNGTTATVTNGIPVSPASKHRHHRQSNPAHASLGDDSPSPRTATQGMSESTDTLVEHPIMPEARCNGLTGSARRVSSSGTYFPGPSSVSPASSHSSPSLLTTATSSLSPQRKDGTRGHDSPADSPQWIQQSRRARAASGASRDLSVSPCACKGAWADTGRLRNPSGGGEMATRRWIGATVATSTSDISDSFVGKEGSSTVALMERGPSVRQHLDVDSLTLFCDERQDLLAELVAEKDRKILELESRLRQAVDIIRINRERQQQQFAPSSVLSNGHSGMLDELLITEAEGGELSSLGTASDASWEAIEETEEKIIMWVPDSSVTHCAGCDGQFWMAKRKHHCRNCGKVFCWECSNYLAPVPHQHLNKPERVCRRCHSTLLQLSPGASSDGRIPTLVADG